MNQTILESRVDSDGVLRVTLPVGEAEANREVRVIVEPLSKKTPSQAAWEPWVDSIAGSWPGEFEKPPQGILEERAKKTAI